MFRAVCPSRKSLSLWEQQRRPPPEAETGRSCWGRGQQDASDSEADAGCRNPGSVCKADGEGEDAEGKRWHSDVPAQTKACACRCAAVLLLWACPLRPLRVQLSQRESLRVPKGATITIRTNGGSVKQKRGGRWISAGIFARKTTRREKRGLTTAMSWDIKKESVLRRGDGLPAKGEAGSPPACAA